MQLEQSQQLKPTNILMSVSKTSDTVFDTPILKEKITDIIFETNKKILSEPFYDISQKKDKAVLAWEENGILHICGNEMIKAPEDSSYLFSGYKKLKTIDFGTCFDTSKTVSMKFMFDGCENLQSLDVSGFDTGNVQYMNGMFFGCCSLETLDVSGFHTDKVVSMNSMFSGCTKLKTLNISGLNTSNVTSMGGMFVGCASLQMLDVTSFNTSKVTDMGWMFSGCIRLEQLDVSEFDTRNVKYMNQMFFNCASLHTLDTRNFEKREGVHTKDMFLGCLSVKSILMKGSEKENVFGSTFNKSQIERIIFVDKIEHLPENAWDISETKNGSVFAWERKGVLHICGKGFIEAPEDSSYLFAGYENLVDINWGEHADEGPCFITSKVKNMNGMFKNCAKLSSVDISKFDIDRVLTMNEMFSGCKSLRDLQLCVVRKGIEVKNIVDGCPMNTKISWMFRKKEN